MKKLIVLILALAALIPNYAAAMDKPQKETEVQMTNETFSIMQTFDQSDEKEFEEYEEKDTEITSQKEEEKEEEEEGETALWDAADLDDEQQQVKFDSIVTVEHEETEPLIEKAPTMKLIEVLSDDPSSRTANYKFKNKLIEVCTYFDEKHVAKKYKITFYYTDKLYGDNYNIKFEKNVVGNQQWTLAIFNSPIFGEIPAEHKQFLLCAMKAAFLPLETEEEREEETRLLQLYEQQTAEKIHLQRAARQEKEKAKISKTQTEEITGEEEEEEEEEEEGEGEGEKGTIEKKHQPAKRVRFHPVVTDQAGEEGPLIENAMAMKHTRVMCDEFSHGENQTMRGDSYKFNNKPIEVVTYFDKNHVVEKYKIKFSYRDKFLGERRDAIFEKNIAGNQQWTHSILQNWHSESTSDEIPVKHKLFLLRAMNEFLPSGEEEREEIVRLRQLYAQPQKDQRKRSQKAARQAKEEEEEEEPLTLFQVFKQQIINHIGKISFIGSTAVTLWGNGSTKSRLIALVFSTAPAIVNRDAESCLKTIGIAAISQTAPEWGPGLMTMWKNSRSSSTNTLAIE